MFTVLLVLLTNSAICSENKVDDSLEINDLVLSFLKELNHLDINKNELYINKISDSFKSSYWKSVSSEEKKNMDIEYVNMFFVTLSRLQKGNIIHSKKEGNLACVFVYKEDVIGAFSLIYEKGWKFMAPSVYFLEHNIPKVCSALGFELGVRNDDLIILDESKQNKMAR